MKQNTIATIGVLLLLVGAAIIGIALGWSVAKKEQPFVVAQEPIRKTQFDVTLECQRLAAMKTAKDWGYQDCLKELGKTIEGRILQI